MNNLWIRRVKKSLIEGRTTNYWIKIRRKATHFDVLIGKKGEKAHIHFGLNPDHTYKFIADRGKVKGTKSEILKQDGSRELIAEKIFNKKGEPQLILKITLKLQMKEGQLHTYIDHVQLSERRFTPKNVK